MNGYATYQVYLAVSRHFSTKSYDFFKYNGKVRVKESTYESRRDKYFFEKAARKYKLMDFVKFLIANYTSGEKLWIGDILNVNGELQMKKWKKHIESFTYSFRNEIDTLADYEESFDNLFKMIDGKHPLLYRMYLRKKVSVETMVALDDLVGYTKLWSKSDDTMLEDVSNLIDKYRPFMNEFIDMDYNKLKKIVLGVFDA